MAEEAKARILSAAAVEFAEKGKAGARMQAIADRAGINKAMLNYYFTSKDQLFREVLSQLMTTQRQRLIEALGEIDNAREFFLKWLEIHHRNVIEQPGWIRLIIHNYLHGDPDTIEMIQSNEMALFFRNKVQSFIDRGELLITDHHQVALLMLGITLTSILAQAELCLPWDEKLFPEETGSDKLKDFLNSRLESMKILLEKGLFAK